MGEIAQKEVMMGFPCIRRPLPQTIKRIRNSSDSVLHFGFPDAGQYVPQCGRENAGAWAVGKNSPEPMYVSFLIGIFHDLDHTTIHENTHSHESLLCGVCSAMQMKI